MWSSSIDYFPIRTTPSHWNYRTALVCASCLLRCSKHFHRPTRPVRKNKKKIVLISLLNFSLAVTLSMNELLSIEQIESFLLPHTHVYIVSLPSHLHQSAILGRITVSYSIDGKHRWERLSSCYFSIRRRTNRLSANCQTIGSECRFSSGSND